MLQLNLIFQYVIFESDQLLIMNVQLYIMKVKSLFLENEIMLIQIKNEHENIKLMLFINLKI